MELFDLEIMASNVIHEMEEVARDDSVQHDTAGPRHLSRVVHDMLPRLMEAPDAPLELLTPSIRLRICDLLFNDDNGDQPDDTLCSGEIDRQVEVVVSVLERLHRQAAEQGLLHHVPAAMPMCG